jgi:hypothetical protein
MRDTGLDDQKIKITIRSHLATRRGEAAQNLC